MNSFRAMPMSGSAVENAELAREQRIQYWLEDPIRCGYLRAFSQSEVTTMTMTRPVCMYLFPSHYIFLQYLLCSLLLVSCAAAAIGDGDRVVQCREHSFPHGGGRLSRLLKY